jgi:hypothetical protein
MLERASNVNNDEKEHTAMWLRLLHAIGLTNLSNEQVEEYVRNVGQRKPSREFSQVNQILALLVLLASLGGYAATVYLTYHSHKEHAKRANEQAADMVLQNTMKVDAELVKLKASISEIRQQQPSARVKDKLVEMEQQVGTLNKANNKIKSKATIDKLANSKAFRVGAIVTPEETKVYKPEQSEEFIRDAGQYIDSHPIEHVGRLEFDGQRCVIGSGGCISISSQSSPWSMGLRIEAIFTDKPIKIAEALEALGDKELAASFASSGDSLCHWLHRFSQPPVFAESTLSLYQELGILKALGPSAWWTVSDADFTARQHAFQSAEVQLHLVARHGGGSANSAGH